MMTDSAIQTATLTAAGLSLHRRWVDAVRPWARLAVLPGYGDHAGRYDHVLRWMAARGVGAHAVDFRGHGRSGGRHGHVRRWDEYLDDLSAFLAIEAFATDDGVPLFVLAHSHGGLVAAAAAERGLIRPDRCRGLILSAPYLALRMAVPRRRRLLAAVLNRVAPALLLGSGISGPMLSRDESMLAADRVDPVRRGGATAGWFTAARRTQADVRAAADRFTLPLLLLLPGDDTVADAAVSGEWFERVGSTDKAVRHYPEHRHELLRELGREAIFGDVERWMRERASQANGSA